MAEAETLIPILAHLRAGAYTTAAGGTILLYDIILTSKDEIRLVWPSEFSLVKCLYFVNRYLPVPCLIMAMYHLANLRAPLSANLLVLSQTPTHGLTSSLCTSPPNHSCKLVTLSLTAGQAIGLVAATWLLVIRVLALYSGNKILSIALYFVFISTHVVTIVLSAIIIQELWGNLAYFELTGVCAGSTPRFLGIVYFVPVICETVLVGLQLFHAYQHTGRLSILRPVTPLLRTLYADGFAYFAVVVALRLWSGIIFTTTDFSYWYLSPSLEFALINTSVSRLVLHLRKAAEIHRHSNMVTSMSMPLSQLTQGPRANNNNANRYRDPKFHIKQNRNGHWPDHHRKPRRNHALSLFQSTTETTSTYPSEIPRFRLEHLPEAESIASMEHGMGANGVDGSRSLLAIPEIGKRSDHGGHRCDSSCEDFDGDEVAGAGSRAGDDRSSIQLSPADPISRTERGESNPPPDIGVVEG